MKLGKIFLGVCLASAAVPSSAAILAEDFNSPAFVGGPLLLNDYSDRWLNTDYFFINNANGWTFSGGAYLAQNSGTSDGALLLNENGNNALAEHALTGLVAGQRYSVRLLLSGDNRQGSPFQLNVAFDGAPAVSVLDFDRAAGSYSGRTVFGTFVATGSTATLSLSQNALSEASPIVDNLLVSVPEPASWAMMLGGFGLLGGAVRVRRRRVVFA